MYKNEIYVINVQKLNVWYTLAYAVKAYMIRDV